MNDEFREEIGATSVPSEEERKAERKLIEAAQYGDKKAFGQLVRKHQKRLFRYIYGLVGSFDATEDIVQEAFVKAFRAIKTFKTQYDFYPWLSTIARNLAYNMFAREEKSQSLDTLTDQGFDPRDVSLGPLERLMESDAQRRFYEALMAMPAQFRAVFVLRHFENMDYAAIGSYLKLPPGTVATRMHRARQFLMQQLEDLL
jgi:RNA polymerase sigma-70 factor (ECF subfamily)